jgi:decaprenylphospho-beta-D-ribofuranose 2-oxidase
MSAPEHSHAAVVDAPARSAVTAEPREGDDWIVSAAQRRMLHGWGRTAPSMGHVLRPREPGEIGALLSGPVGRYGGLIARGAGRSYGDAAQNAGGLVLDMTGLDSVKFADAERGSARVGAGTTLATLLDALAAHGLTLPVVPGTKHVTVGGAIAADIHGKNHHRDGSFAHHVESLTLCAPGGQAAELSRSVDTELFYATIGGMGLTGVVVDAVLSVQPLPGSSLWADIDRTDDLESAVALLSEDDPRYRYEIAWVDLLGEARGAGGGVRRGRSVVVRSNYAPDSGPITAPRGERARPTVPKGFPGGVLNRATARAFNELRWRLAPRRARERPCAQSAHFFPLDAVAHWNRLYGAEGLIQYQFAVPRGEEQTLFAVVESLRRARLPMYLVVLKRFGAGSGGLMSFPREGLTLAIDLPAGAPELRAALDEADRLVAAAAGRVYLAKDARLRADAFAAMYPELERFNAVRERVDPDGVLRSDMARRFGLSGTARSARR